MPGFTAGLGQQSVPVVGQWRHADASHFEAERVKIGKAIRYSYGEPLYSGDLPASSG